MLLEWRGKCVCMQTGISTMAERGTDEKHVKKVMRSCRLCYHLSAFISFVLRPTAIYAFNLVATPIHPNPTLTHPPIYPILKLPTTGRSSPHRRLIADTAPAHEGKEDRLGRPRHGQREQECQGEEEHVLPRRLREAEEVCVVSVGGRCMSCWDV